MSTRKVVSLAAVKAKPKPEIEAAGEKLIVSLAGLKTTKPSNKPAFTTPKNPNFVPRQAHPGGKIVTNKKQALLKFLARKESRGEQLSAEQMKALEDAVQSPKASNLKINPDADSTDSGMRTRGSPRGFQSDQARKELLDKLKEKAEQDVGSQKIDQMRKKELMARARPLGSGGGKRGGIGGGKRGGRGRGTGGGGQGNKGGNKGGRGSARGNRGGGGGNGGGRGRKRKGNAGGAKQGSAKKINIMSALSQGLSAGRK